MPGSPADDEYTVGPEDVIQIQVWGKPELSGSVTVDYSGGILAPLLGEVRAAGMTPADLTADLTERYRLLDTSISEVLVSVIQYNSLSVTVLGEVRSPGTYGFREMPDVWDALLAAGGTTPVAELTQVQIVRTRRQEHEPRTLTLDLTRGIEGTSQSSLPALRPKDQILVPSAQGAPIGGDNVRVLGAVGSPGVYRLANAQDVISALTISGGYLPTANLNKVYVTRTTSQGAISYQLRIGDYLMDAGPLDNMQLQAGDTVTVEERLSFWRTFTSSLRGLVPIASLVTTIILATR